MAEADLSKLVGVIMENPSLIEQIKELAGTKNGEEEPTPEESIAEELTHTDGSTRASTYRDDSFVESRKKEKRTELLKALKPYISTERGRAIETMISIADMLDMMRGQ